MADNGHSNCNNRTKAPATRLNLDEYYGRTESDTAHFRLRSDQHPKKLYTCYSCNQKFEGTSLMHVYAHYAETEHENYYSLCLYCQGKVHQYKGEGIARAQIYHNCLRSKRGENN